VRVERSGRRRYLDATWEHADGRTVIVEVDAGLQFETAMWWQEQYQAKEVLTPDAIRLTFPSVLVRTGPARVAERLRQALARLEQR
jgi:hypothetical protein